MNYQVVVSHFGGHPQHTVISEEEVRKSGYSPAVAMEREFVVPTTLECGTPAIPLPDSEKVFKAFQDLQQDHERLLKEYALLKEQFKGKETQQLSAEGDLKAAVQKIQGLQAEQQNLRNQIDRLTVENKKLTDLIESHTAPTSK